MIALDLLKRGDDESRRGVPEGAEVRRAARRQTRRRLLCRSCGSPVTGERERVAIGGQHLHRRTNPAGIEFEFGCFVAAPGAETLGEPTTEFSWFSGYTWVYSICRGCGGHLGWFFQGAAPSFYGLILICLVPETAEDPLH
jgi:hypothetical protein